MTQRSSSRPNVLFINTDQQSASMMSCTGNPYLKTPAVDRLASEGIRFERAYCTNPICLPSRFSFFTGRMPSELDIWTNKNPHVEKVPQYIHETTAGRLLKNAGYRVGYGGKVHLPGDLSPESMGCENISKDKRDSLAESSAKWLIERGVKNDGPFFLSICLVNPHDICFMAMRDHLRATRGDRPDLNVNEKWLLSDDSIEMQELNEALKIPEGVSEDDFFANLCPSLPDNHHPQSDEPEALREFVTQLRFNHYIRENWDEKTWRLHRWAYCRLTERVDRQIGIILNALDKASLTEDTLVIFTSDHGEHDGSHQLVQKSMFYEEASRIPLLLRWPKAIAAGQVNQTHLVSNGLDIVPTLCDLAGIDTPKDLKGQSLLPWATHQKSLQRPRRALPLECPIGQAIVTDRFKYIRYKKGNPSEQLMDLQNDPGETQNHFSKPEHKEDIATCREYFEEHFSGRPVPSGSH